jgi:hypothetical protein
MGEIRNPAPSKDPVNQRQISLQERTQNDLSRRPMKEMKLFVVELGIAASLFIIAILSFRSAFKSYRVTSIRYRIFIGHALAIVSVLFLSFLLNGIYWIEFVKIPSTFEILLTLGLASFVRYFTKSHVLTRNFILDLLSTGILLWIISFFLIIGFEAFLLNGFGDYPVKLVVLTCIWGGIFLNLFLLRKEFRTKKGGKNG